MVFLSFDDLLPHRSNEALDLMSAPCCLISMEDPIYVRIIIGICLRLNVRICHTRCQKGCQTLCQACFVSVSMSF